MSKLDQLKALGAAKRAERQGSRGGVEMQTRRKADLGRAKDDLGRASGLAKPLSPEGEQPLTSPAGVAPGPRETKSKGGRPLAKDADKALMQTKPWIAAGMSRASWYRRRAEKPKIRYAGKPT